MKFYINLLLFFYKNILTKSIDMCYICIFFKVYFAALEHLNLNFIVYITKIISLLYSWMNNIKSIMLKHF